MENHFLHIPKVFAAEAAKAVLAEVTEAGPEPSVKTHSAPRKLQKAPHTRELEPGLPHPCIHTPPSSEHSAPTWLLATGQQQLSLQPPPPGDLSQMPSPARKALPTQSAFVTYQNTPALFYSIISNRSCNTLNSFCLHGNAHIFRVGTIT